MPDNMEVEPNTVYVDGDTVMHYAARHATSVEHFERLINHVDPEDRIEYVLTINDLEETVFDVINENLTADDADKLTAHLLNYAFKKRIKPLKEQISFAEIEQKYGLIAGTERYKNFKAAVNIANTIRSQRVTSLTHPDSSGTSCNALNEANEKLQSYRNNCDSLFMDFYCQEADLTIESSSENSITFEINTPEQKKRKLEGLANYFLYSGIANCEELAGCAYRLGEKSNLQITNYCIENGDHVFSVIGDDESPDAVVCDPWSGLICLFSEKHKIGSFRPIIHQDKLYNLIMNFNPRCQSLEVYNFNSMDSLQITATFADTYVDKIIKSIVDQVSSVKEKFLFALVIKNNLDYALSERLIDEKIIDGWSADGKLPFMLKRYFSGDLNYIPSLCKLYGASEPLFEMKIARALTNDADPNFSGTDGETALLFACRKGYTNTVKLLLAAGAKPNCACEIEGKTPLMSAIIQKNETIVDLLLAEANNHLGLTTFSAYFLRTCAMKVSLDALQKMNAHIANLSEVHITPQQFAEILGYDSIAFKLSKYASMQMRTPSASKSQCTVFSQDIVMQESEDNDCGVNDTRFAINNG